MNLRDIRYLVAVAEHQHFGKAARACFVSQPTLSTQLKKLEEELGIQLFERTNARVLTTLHGQTVVSKAKDILREVDQLKEIAQLAADPLAGPFRFGLIPTLAPYVLPHIMPEINAAFPQLELLLIEDKTEVLMAQLKQGTLDAAMLALPIDDDLLTIQPLFDEPFYVALPKDNVLAKQDKLQIDDLAGETLLLLAEGHCLADQALDVCRAVEIQEKTGFRATSLETLRLMVAHGSGVTLLPALATQFNTNVGLVIKPFVAPMPTRCIAMVSRRKSARKASCEAIQSVISAQIKPLV